MKYLAATKKIPAKLKARHARDPVPENPTNAWKQHRKKEIIEALFSRQKGICAYCEIELEIAHDTGIGRHIEHILAKSRHPELTFEYSNMLLSCFTSGGKIAVNEHDPEPVSCGHAPKKKTDSWDETLFIKPTDNDCERYFSFELEGEISPHPNLNEQERQQASYTIDLLNLNCLRLKRLREDIITKGYEIMDDLQNNTEALHYFLEFETIEFNGKLREFINLRLQHFN